MANALVAFGLWGDEPATKHDGLLWLTPQAQLAIWYNGAWRGIRNDTLWDYGPTTLVPTPANAATTLLGVPASYPAPQTNGRLLFNTTTMRLMIWDHIGWLQLQ